MIGKFNSDRTSALKRFANREKPIEVFTKGISDYNNSSEIFMRVIVYYGIGGIGKTALLKKLLRVYKHNASIKRKEHNIININLRAIEINTPINILLTIRNQLKIRCDLFDFAILKYWKLLELSDKRIKDKLDFFTKSSLLWELTDNLSPISTQPFRTLFKYAYQKYKKRFGKFKDEISLIDTLDIEELQERLPYFLGLSIKSEYQKSKNIIFIDSFETLDDKKGADYLHYEEWLYELIASSMSGLYIIGSREYIKWGEKDDEWKKYLDQHILGTLSENDCKFFLKGIPILEDSIISNIINSSNGLPFYLDLCANIYLQLKESNSIITSDIFNLSKEQIIDRFLSHLDTNLKELFKLLSLFENFEQELVKYLINNYSIGFPTTLFNKIINYTIVEEIGINNKLYRIHTDIKEYIKRTIQESHKINVYKELLFFLNKNRTILSTELHLRYHSQISRDLDDINYSKDFIKNYLDIGLNIISEGYWIEMCEMYKEILEIDYIKRNLSNIKTSMYFLYSLSIRRTGSVKKAYRIISCINKKNRKTLGQNYSLSIIFHKTNYIRILGKYDKAFENYSFLIKKGKDVLSFSEYLKIRRQYADILFLKGNFQEALEVIDDITKNSSFNSINSVEAYRIKGHLFRFNLDYIKAIDIYNTVKDISIEKSWYGLLGKSYTNLVESYSWIDPQASIRYGKYSIKLNENLESNIELGKTYSALVIAHLLLGNKKKAVKCYKKSIKLHNISGYKSGLLFAELSKYFIHFSLRDLKKSKKQIEAIQFLIKKLKVYEFLLLPIYISEDKINAIDKLKNIKWLDLNESIRNFKTISIKI
jgi:tetratricopeptide (TPR) repeat protein